MRLQRLAAAGAVALASLALSATPAAAKWTATSCTIFHFDRTELGPDYGVITSVNEKGNIRTKEYSPDKASKEFEKTNTGQGCTIEIIE